MSRTPDELIETYIQNLTRALGDLPRERRREVVEEVAEHFAEARAELPAESEAEIRNLLERVGDPDELAADARERFGVRRRGGGIQEISAIVLLLVGGFVFAVGWFVGVVLLWASEAWTTRDKLIGTFLVPFGLLPFVWTMTFTLAAVPTDVYCDSGPVGGQTEAVTVEGCTNAGWSSVLDAVALPIVLLIAPIFTTIYLARRMRRPVEVATAS